MFNNHGTELKITIRVFLGFIRGLVLVFIFSKTIIITPVSKALPIPDTPVVFSETRIENNFPDSLVFTVHVTADQDIQEAEFRYHGLNDPSTSMNKLDIQPSRELELKFKLDTTQMNAVPTLPIYFRWQILLANGERFQSPETDIFYDDIRFDWEVLTKGNLAVYWHDRSEAFGMSAFDIATQAFEDQQELYISRLDFPIRIIIYNNRGEFTEWQKDELKFANGMAFPRQGITTQYIQEDRFQVVLGYTLPHEISHLYFYQETHNALSEPPAWLDEGLAEYNAFGDKHNNLLFVRSRISRGNYIPLRVLHYRFYFNGFEDYWKTRQAYSESLSAITFLIERYGIKGLCELMAAYREGNSTDTAFPSALKLTHVEFEQSWLESLAAPEGVYSTIKPIEFDKPLELPTPQRIAQCESKASPVPTPTLQLENQEHAAPFIFVPIWLCISFCAAILFILLIIFADRRWTTSHARRNTS